jgi:hypothetical protein
MDCLIHCSAGQPKMYAEHLFVTRWAITFSWPAGSVKICSLFHTFDISLKNLAWEVGEALKVR